MNNKGLIQSDSLYLNFNLILILVSRHFHLTILLTKEFSFDISLLHTV